MCPPISGLLSSIPLEVSVEESVQDSTKGWAVVPVCVWPLLSGPRAFGQTTRATGSGSQQGTAYLLAPQFETPVQFLIDLCTCLGLVS